MFSKTIVVCILLVTLSESQFVTQQQAMQMFGLGRPTSGISSISRPTSIQGLSSVSRPTSIQRPIYVRPNNVQDNTVQTYSCGQTKGIFPITRIVGGRRALPNEYPYQVALETARRSVWSGSSSYRQFCGASIINDRWIVTAAHCLSRQNVNALRGAIGTSNLREMNRTSVNFDRLIIHPQYNSFSVANDIGLLRTTSSIRSAANGRFVSPVCLPRQGQQFTGTGVISGFGHVREGGPSSPLLLSSVLNILPDTSCRSTYGSEYSVPEMLCGGYLSGGRDTCQGDSGGPFAQRTGNGWTLVGITSFGRGCARANTPGVYTRVSNYVNWISSTIRANS